MIEIHLPEVDRDELPRAWLRGARFADKAMGEGLLKLGGHARVVATGRSDFPNQLNNVLVFPGIFRGALDVRATVISESMKLAAANAIADLVEAEELTESYIIPSPFDPRVATAVARAVTDTARREGLARRPY